MSEDVRWLWIDECGDPWAGDDLDDDWVPVLRAKYRRYCPSCGQVVQVRQADGEVTVPRHLVTDESGRYMTSCETTYAALELEPAP